MHGASQFERVSFAHTTTGVHEHVDVRAMFCFIGDVSESTAWRAAGRAPFPYETSQPGIFAVGDVRAGSIKRGAAAVGEGSACVRSVHEHLALRE